MKKEKKNPVFKRKKKISEMKLKGKKICKILIFNQTKSQDSLNSLNRKSQLKEAKSVAKIQMMTKKEANWDNLQVKGPRKRFKSEPASEKNFLPLRPRWTWESMRGRG